MFREDEQNTLHTNTIENLLERENLTVINEERPDANTPLRVLTPSSIMGDRVENPQGEKLGQIKNIMLNLQTGTIEYYVLETGGVLGIGGKLFAIPFKAMKVNPEKKFLYWIKARSFLSLHLVLIKIIGLKQISII